jgi:serine/threonine protein kinase
MPLLQVCGQGHRWDPTSDRRPTVQERWNRCPVCGGGVDLVSLRDTHATAAGDSAPDVTITGDKPSTTLPTIAGYEILGHIGHGGMGVVYRARQLDSGRLVALKMVSSGAHASPSEKARFRTETESARRIRHPHVVEVYEVGEQNGLPFVAFEFMDRGSLAEALGGSQMPPRYAAELVELLARGVQAAHEQGVLHRDIKPGNVMLLTPPADDSLPVVVQLLGVPKITDFGLAKRMDAEGALTRTGAVMGTPSYMAPEQAEGRIKHSGPAVDVHALGAILYEALTGRPPFKGATMMETLDQVRTLEPTSPTQVVPGTPRDLSTICLKALAKDPARRYPSAEAMADDLHRFIAGETIAARPMGPLERGARWMRKRTVPLAGTAVVLVALAVAAGAVLKDRPKKDIGPVALDDPNAAVVQHFANFVTRRGAPEGVGLLSEADVRRRDLSYRLTSRKGKVETVEAVGRTGQLTNEHNIAPYLEDDRDQQPLPVAGRRRATPERRPNRDDCRWEFGRKDNGELTEERAYDREGRLVWGFHYLTPTTGFYTDRRDIPRPRAGSGAAYVAFEYSPEGWTTTIRYRDHNGNPRGDGNDIFGRKFVHDEHGFVIRESYLGPRDLPMLHPDGFATEERPVDAQGNVLERRFLGLDGRLARSYGVGGWAKEVMTYDGDGHLLEWKSLDVDGKPLRSPAAGPGGGFGFAGLAGTVVIRNSYDDQGRRIGRAYFDHDGKPLNSGGGFAPDGGPVFLSGHRTEFRYDDAGRCIEELNFDAEGKPTGTHRMMQYDDRGRIIETKSTTVMREGRNLPAALRTSSTIRMKYDDGGRLTEQAFFDENGKPVVRSGVHRTTATIGPGGRPLEITLFDAEGHPAGERSEIYTGPRNAPDRQPPTVVVGPARFRLTWNERGDLTDLAAFDAEGRPYVTPGDRRGGFFSIGLTTFVRGWIPVQFVTGEVATRTTWRFDDRGNVTEVATFDAEDKPFVNSRFYAARMTMAYDEHGKCTETAYFAADGKLTSPRPTFTAPIGEAGGRIARPAPARTTARYDADGRLIAVAYFDAADRPLVANNNGVRREWTYDPFGRLRQHRSFDIDGKAVESFGRDYTHDELGRLTSISFPEGAIDASGFRKVAYSYDADGRLVDVRYSDAAGKQVMTRTIVRTPTTFARALGLPIPRRVDENGNLIREARWPVEVDDEIVSYDGKPVRSGRLLFARKAEEDYGTTRELTVRRGDKTLTLSVPSGPSRMTDVTASRQARSRLVGFGIGGLPLPASPTDSVFGLSTVAGP